MSAILSARVVDGFVVAHFTMKEHHLAMLMKIATRITVLVVVHLGTLSRM
jgi:hypothetical protein